MSVPDDVSDSLHVARAKITREAAHLKGLKRFYTGEPCKRGHDSERFVANGGCVQCMNFSTPGKRKVFQARNVYWPTQAFIFETMPPPTPEEMQAAVNLMRARRWHESTLQEVRKDPALLASHLDPIPIGEEIAARNLIERRHRVLQAVRTANSITDEGEPEA